MPALQVWMGMNLLFSFASYGLSSYEWYLAGALAEVVRRLIQQAPAATAADAASTGAMSSCARLYICGKRSGSASWRWAWKLALHDSTITVSWVITSSSSPRIEKSYGSPRSAFK